MPLREYPMPRTANPQVPQPSCAERWSADVSGEFARPPAFAAFLPVKIAPATSPALSPHQRQGTMCTPHLASNGYTSVKYVV
jgi:hypothetical protein